MSMPKWGAKKSRTQRRRPATVVVVPRKKRSPRYRRPLLMADTTVTKLNPGKPKIISVIKSLKINADAVESSAATNGFTIKSTGTAATYQVNMVFDPAGSFGNNSGPINTTVGTGSLVAAAIPEWSSYAALYSRYKVKKVHLHFKCVSTASLTLAVTSPTLYIRYLNEYNPSSISLITISEERNWIRKVFTPEQPDFKYSFYPKCMALNDNINILSTDSRLPVSMRMTSVSTPVELYGVSIYVAIPTNSLQWVIQCDVTYDIMFQEQN